MFLGRLNRGSSIAAVPTIVSLFFLPPGGLLGGGRGVPNGLQRETGILGSGLLEFLELGSLDLAGGECSCLSGFWRQRRELVSYSGASGVTAYPGSWRV
ncbi:hypothetical protein B0T24DRAFT_315544 [Lasiosphaeria ovina]|uniref:Uncharacterized protein n=1 Tax=Lasiosphaeria ovina TaxID=92902 RepID=A0AAE0K8G0_9PEZI|nr:hypothetical protein B0T24DRAFT_315544 [Lasiosphaeria ovina]